VLRLTFAGAPIGVASFLFLAPAVAFAEGPSDSATRARGAVADDAPASTNAYVTAGLRLAMPAAHAVDGVGSMFSVGPEFGAKFDQLRLGAGIELGQANDCSGCSPFAAQWSTLSGGVSVGFDLLRFRGWGVSATAGAMYTLALLNWSYMFTKSLWRPDAHIALWAGDYSGLSRIELDVGYEEWLAVGDHASAVTVRIGILRDLSL
jgi:hypothetical protein